MQSRKAATTYSSIMVPLDGSDFSERALQFASFLAGRAQSRLILVRAMAIQTPSAAPFRESGEAYLQETADRLLRSGLDVEFHAYSDDPASAIVNAAELSLPIASRTGPAAVDTLPRQTTEMIIMVTHGLGVLAGLLHESVTEQVFASAEMPLMVVPPKAMPWPSDRPLRVVVPMDGSALAEVALSTAASLASMLGGRMIALQVVAGSNETGARTSDGSASALAEAKSYLESAVIPFCGETPIECMAVAGPAASTILGVIAERGVDLVVLATHGDTGRETATMGSVAKDVLASATVPVVLVKPTILQFARANSERTAARELVAASAP